MKLAQLVPPLRKQAIASDRSGKREKCPKKRKEVQQLEHCSSRVPRGEAVERRSHRRFLVVGIPEHEEVWSGSLRRQRMQPAQRNRRSPMPPFPAIAVTSGAMRQRS